MAGEWVLDPKMCQMEEIEFNFDLTPKPVLKLLYVLLHVQSRVCLFQEIVYWFYVESSLPKAVDQSILETENGKGKCKICVSSFIAILYQKLNFCPLGLV